MRHDPRIMVHGVPTFYGVYETYKQKVMTYGGRSWNSTTTRQYDGYVLNRIIPHIKDHDKKHIGMYTKQELDDVMASIVKHGKNGPGQPYEPWDSDGVLEKLDLLIRAVVWAASEQLLCDDLYGTGVTERTNGAGIRTGEQQARTMRSLTVRQDRDVYRYLTSHLDQTGPDAGLMLMYAMGLRNNDACGMNFGYIKEFIQYPGNYYLVVPQSTELGANTLKVLGKTANSGRRVPLPDKLAILLLALMEKRAKLAAEKGHPCNPEDLPIVCKRNVPWERCSSDDLTRVAKKMFEKIGMRTEDFVALNQELMEEAQGARDEMEEDLFRQIESEPTAYLLRRNFATHIAALGLQEAEIQYVMGHKIEDDYVQRRSFGDERMLIRIKRKLDERPLLNSINEERTLSLEQGAVVPFGGSKKIRLEVFAEDLANLRINVTAQEPGDEIHLRISGDAENTAMKGEYLSYSTEPLSEPSRTIDGIRFYHGKYQQED